MNRVFFRNLLIASSLLAVIPGTRAAPPDVGSGATEAEFRDLFAAAGLLLTRVIPTASPNSILEGVPG